MRRIILSSILIASGIWFAACGGGGISFEQSDTHSRGKAKIYFEESYKPLFETSIYTFEGLFPSAKIQAIYSSEGEIIDAFFKKKTKTICITRDFTAEEKSDLKKAQIEVRSNIIAHDAIALIIHPSNTDSVLSIQQLKDILSGKQTTWKGSGKNINVVFDKVNSANFNYLHQLIDKKTLPQNVYAVKSNKDVIEHVKNNPSSIGVIGVNWISDQDDATVLGFRKEIRVMSISEKEGGPAYEPYQAYIHTKEYPLTRDVWFINMASRSGLHSGFINFMQQEKGQLIIHKSALVTAGSPIRLIGFEKE